jgi:hypothetical protein
METNEDRSASKTPKSEPMILGGLRLFPFIPLMLTPKETLEDLMRKDDT